MPKTNYTKVEEVLEQGLRKMNIDQLFDETGKTGPKELKAQKKLLETVQREIKFFDSKKHKTLYEGLGLKKQDIKALLSNAQLTPTEWEKIKEIKAKIDKYRRELAAQLPSETNENLIEQERVKHINKRYNVNDKWLPLH